jgi:hypothetical protein
MSNPRGAEPVYLERCRRNAIEAKQCAVKAVEIVERTRGIVSTANESALVGITQARSSIEKVNKIQAIPDAT